MSENIDSEYARPADTEYLVRRSMTKGYQLFSIITPPIYAGFGLFRKGRGYLTVNRLLRATWLGGAAGVASGGAFEIRAVFDTASIRADDHATIGALLFAVLTPSIFWRRATTIHLIFGGAGLGTAVGYFTHIARSASGDVPPKIVVSQIASDS